MAAPIDSNTASSSDADLARRVMAAPAGRARGEEHELCRRFARRLRLYGLRHLHDEDAAADLVQRTLELTIMKLRRGEVREPDRIASFVLGVARMQAHEMRRRARREEPSDSAIAEIAVDVPPVRPLATERLARCLEALGGRERSVVVLSFFDERSAGEIAAALSTSAGNVRVLRHRAVERLRRCMDLEEDVT